jgi:hypothetical protein
MTTGRGTSDERRARRYAASSGLGGGRVAGLRDRGGGRGATGGSSAVTLRIPTREHECYGASDEKTMIILRSPLTRSARLCKLLLSECPRRRKAAKMKLLSVRRTEPQMNSSRRMAVIIGPVLASRKWREAPRPFPERASRDAAPTAARSAVHGERVAEHRPAALGLLLSRLVLNDVPALRFSWVKRGTVLRKRGELASCRTAYGCTL